MGFYFTSLTERGDIYAFGGVFFSKVLLFQPLIS